MKNSNNRIIIVLAFCAINILGLFPGNTFAQIVTNGSFESSNTGIVSANDIDGWLIQVAGAVNPVPDFEIVSDTVKDGTRALKVTVHGLGSNQWDIQVVSDSIPATQGTTYNYSVWAKAQKPGGQVSFTVGNYSYSEYKVIRPANLTTEWQKFSMQFTVDDDVSYIRAPIHFNYSGDTNNAVYIDNLQIVDDKFGKTPIIVEAESGIAGSHFTTNTDGEITYVTTDTNYTSLTNPGSSSRIISYQIAFPDSGYYNLFALLRVGSGGYNDDSFFAGKGFGEKTDTSSTDWVMINGLGGAGFTNSTDVVEEIGNAGSEVWKWVNITKNFFPGDTAEETFFISLDNLTKTFQIGSREDGLYFDKFAFGKSYLFYTVNALDNILPGSTTIVPFDSSNFYQGPPYAQGKSKFLGNAYGDIPDNVFANYWNQLTPGNAGKWGSVASLQDSTNWNWTSLDKIYNYSIANSLIFKNHTMIWGQQQPSWISGLDSETQLKYIETWFRQVGQRYPNMDMIDVVNEAIASHNPPDGLNGRANYKEALGGNGTTGWDWVIKSFELARKYMPAKTKLLINDYGIINSNDATTTYLIIINLLNDRGLIDGIGVQGHRFEFENASLATLTSNLDRLSATGLPVYISEFDLGNINDSGTPDDNKQLELYKKIFPVLWVHPGVKGITLWGYLEGQMWQTTCYLVLADGTNRPALDWLANYVDTATFPAINNIQEVISDKNLEQNYPNPFNSVTTIGFTVVKSANVSLKIYDVMGREIATLIDKNLTAGEHKVNWDANNNGNTPIQCGTYYYRLVIGNDVVTKKMLLIK